MIWRLLCAARPDTCEAIQEGLNKLAMSAQEVVHVFDVDPESQAAWWARAFAAQCQAALDELTFLAPWTAPPFSVEALGDFPHLSEIPTLRTLANLDKELFPASVRARERIEVIEDLASQSGELARVDYDFLYDKARHLLAIGYSISEKRRDASYYDLLASEARLVQFCRHCPGTIAAGELVCPGTPAYYRRRRADSPVLERLHVRISYAVACNAHI